MAHMSPEEFEAIWQNSRKAPVVRQAQIKKVQIDLSLSGILDRYMVMADRFLAQGKIQKSDHDALATSVAGLKAILQRMNEKDLVTRSYRPREGRGAEGTRPDHQSGGSDLEQIIASPVQARIAEGTPQCEAFDCPHARAKSLKLTTTCLTFAPVEPRKDFLGRKNRSGCSLRLARAAASGRRFWALALRLLCV